MRFLRMATNALIAGALGAAYLTVLLLQLNPHVPLASASAWAWFGALWLLYGLHLSVLCYVLLVGREFFALDPFSPGWISVRVLAWFGAALAAGAAALMWLNLEGLRLALTEEAARRMLVGAVATTAAAAVLFGIAVAHYSFGRRGSRVGASLFVLAAFASLALPLAARGPADPPRGSELSAIGGFGAAGATADRRVVLILLDGASLDYIWPRAAEGRLPHFRRLLEDGASMSLATIRPTQPGPVWASVATGMYPARSGVRAAATYHTNYGSDHVMPVELLPDHCLAHVLGQVGLVREELQPAATWRARPLWSILGRAGLTVGLVRWPSTHPAPDIPGFAVSDRYHELGDSVLEITRAVQPRAALPPLQHLVDPLDGSAKAAHEAFEGVAGLPARSALRRDALYSALGRTLAAGEAPRLLAVRFTGLDTVGHHYLQQAAPPRPREAADEDRRRKAQVLERYYGYVDDQIGEALGRLHPGDLLLVVSGFGMQRLNPLKRALGRLLSGLDYTGTHDRAPDGFLLAFGTAVAPGSHARGAIVDVAPTVLYFLGLPVARDMDGYARTDLFDRHFTEERPIAFIPTYSN